MTTLEHNTGDLERENAELRRQLAEREAALAEATARESAMSEVLQVINSSPGDLAPVFDAILEKATTLCDAKFGLLQLYDAGSGGFRFAAGHDLPAAVIDFLRQRESAGNPIRPLPGGMFGPLIAGEPSIQIQDIGTWDRYRTGTAPMHRVFYELGGARTWLSVALRKDGCLVGILSIYRREIRPFSERHTALVQNFAAQAVIAMENARLLTETREALEQQTATAEVLRVINSSPGDLMPVFDAMLEKALSLCEASFGILYTYDGERFSAAALRGLPEAYATVVTHDPIRASPLTGLGRIASGQRLVHILDLADEEAYRVREPLRVATVELGGARSNLYVPLLKDDVLIGVLTAYRQEVRPFTEKQIALLQNFAAQAVIAMENARLIIETREALEQQTATAEVLGVINASPGDLVPVFDAMLEKAMRLCEAACGFLSTYDGACFNAAATRGVPTDLPLAPVRPGSGGSFELLVRGEDVIRVADIRDSEGYRTGRRARRGFADRLGARTAVWVALRKDRRLLGAFILYRQEVRPFTDKQIALLQNFAAQAVIAMENARLITETREALEQQTATAEVLRVINSSPGDLAPVFDAILEKAHLLCESPSGSLQVLEGDELRAVATRGLAEPYAAMLRRGYRPQATAQIAKVTQVDIAELAATNPESEWFRCAAQDAKLRTVLFVPLLKEGAVLGRIAASRHELRPFSEKQIKLLENFAAQAVIAMENARLLTETREALEQQTATAEVLQVINSSPGDLAPVFDAILEKAHSLCGVDRGHLMTYDGENFHAVAMHNLPERFAEMLRRPFPADPGTPNHRLLRGEPFVHIPDLATAGALSVSGQAGLEAGSRTVLLVALRKEAALLGIIGASRTEVRPFTDKQITLLQNFAAQAVIAMENARLLGELRARTDEVAAWNRELEDRVAAQLGELERVGKLKRFLAPQLAELIVARGDEGVLETHRRDIVVVFCDLRGFTAFAETAEPEEVLDLLREYHGALGPIVGASEGTLDHFSGDGIMVFFNDPVPVPDASERAVRMAVEMRTAMARLQAQWRRQGREIGFGVGIARGYATLGQIGFADRVDYTAIGTVCNLAARLCAEAKDGQILISRRVAAAVEEIVQLEEIGDLALKGLMQAVAVFNVAGEIAPTVIEGQAANLP